MNPIRIISRFPFPSGKWLMRALAASVEPFLHHTFGERYASNLFSGLLVVVLMIALGSLIPRPQAVNLMPLVAAALLVRLLAHFISVWQRRRAGVHVASHSNGSSWSFWSKLRFPTVIVQTAFEPLLCLAIAVLLSTVDSLFSVWLSAAGIALLWKTLIERRRAHHHMLDVLDARMAARNLHTLVNRREINPQAIASPTAVNLAPPATPTRPQPGLFENLDPALQRMIHEETPATAAPGTVAVHPQPIAGVPVEPSRANRIHVRPMVISDPAPGTNPAASQPKPRVVVVRIRPNPTPPLRVTHRNFPITPQPTRPPSKDVPAENPIEAIPMQADLPNFRTSDVPKPAEIRKGQDAQVQKPITFSRPAEEHEALSSRIVAEAKSLGFAVECASEGSGSLNSNFQLSNSTASIAVIIAGSTEDCFEKIKSCVTTGPRVAVVSENRERLRTIAESVHTYLALEKAMTVSYFTPEEFSSELLRLAQSPATNSGKLA